LPINHAGVLKVKKVQMEITLSMLEAENKSLSEKLRTAEQERDQYKSAVDNGIGVIEGYRNIVQSLRAQIKEEQDGSPSEIEMHRMAFKMIQDHGFSCHEELLAAYRHLERSQVKLSKEVAEALDECERL
jgi:hypothetical protein